MNNKQIFALVAVFLIIIVGVGIMSKCVGVKKITEVVVVQPYAGEARIQNGSGVYWKGMADTWSYDLYMELVYSDESGEGDRDKESVKVTFNDGSTANISAFVVVELPTDKDDMLAFHKKMNGNPLQIKNKVKAHLIECMKSTAPLMSSTEHQVSRKSEYSQTVENQLRDGVYDMKQVRKVLADRFDAEGLPVSVAATEVLMGENGRPVIAKRSPLTEDYKLSITQFSIKGTDYDPETLKQFSAKKEQFLAAEQSKAEREAMVQEALKIEAEGLKDKAQAEAEANVHMATAVIAAELKANVALQHKIEMETQAQEKLSVAEISKQEQLMIAGAKLEVAEIAAQEAEAKKRAMISEAEGRKQAIELSGAITELEQAMIDAEVQKATNVSKNLATIKVPNVMFIGGKDGSGGSDITEHLINIRLMEASDLFEKVNVNKSAVEKRVDRVDNK
jgi:hypothetical protein